jgi:hypothetical protein
VNAAGLLVATVHPALAATLGEAGASVVTSAAMVDAHLEEGEPRALLVAQDLPGLTPERVMAWAQGRADRVAVWLETDPPPAWGPVRLALRHWHGELSQADLEAWIDGLERHTPYGITRGVHLVLETPPGREGVATCIRWAQALTTRLGPGLTVDADWTSAALTEQAAPAAWRRYDPGQAMTVVRWRLGWIAPAPPPWEVGPVVPPDRIDEVLRHRPPWTVVYLGPDIRTELAARWLARGDDLLWLGAGASPWRIRQTRELLRAMTPHLPIAVPGSMTVAETIRLPAEWPGAGDPLKVAGGLRKLTSRIPWRWSATRKTDTSPPEP